MVGVLPQLSHDLCGSAPGAARTPSQAFETFVAVDQQQRQLAQDSDRREIALGIVSQILIKRGPDAECTVGPKQYRIAVRCRMRHRLGADMAAGPLSTATCLPNPRDMASATARASTSNEPPAVKVTTMVNGRSGYRGPSAIARNDAAPSDAAKPATAAKTNRATVSRIGTLLSECRI